MALSNGKEMKNVSKKAMNPQKERKEPTEQNNDATHLIKPGNACLLGKWTDDFASQTE